MPSQDSNTSIQVLQQQVAALQQAFNTLARQQVATGGNPNLPIGVDYNTYIGARYVPKFAEPTEWSTTEQYEPLTIVTYQGNSYTSKTFPPVGALPTNTTYWANTGNYNAQVELYRQETANVQNSLNSINQSIDTINNDIDETNTKINQNINSINTLNSKIFIQNKKFLFIGDSYGAQSNSWVTWFVQALGITQYNNACVSGSGFSLTNSFLNQLPLNGDYTDIVVAGGLNDSNQASLNSGLTNAIQQFATTAKQRFTNANLYLAYIGNARDNAPLLDGRVLINREFCLYQYKEAVSRGFIYLNGSENILCQSALLLGDDGIHPSPNGAQQLGQKLAEAYQAGSVGIFYPEFKISAQTPTQNVMQLTFSINGDIAQIGLQSAFYTLKNGCTGNTELSLGTVNHIFLNHDVYITDYVNVAIATNAEDYTTGQVTLHFYQDQLTFKFNNVVNKSFENLPANTQIQFTAKLKVNFPAIWLA